jgi:hypothetical protein
MPITTGLQHRGHSNRGDEPRAGEELPASRGQREHAIFAVAIFQSRNIPGLPLRDGLAEAAERLFDRTRLCIPAFKVGGMHGFVSLARRQSSKSIDFRLLPPA